MKKKRDWRNGPINGAYLRASRKANSRVRSINGQAALRRQSMAGKVVAVNQTQVRDAPEISTTIKDLRIND